MTNTTLGQVKVGDEITRISETPAARVTVGIAWTDVPQRLVVKAVIAYGANVTLRFENGGVLFPTAKRTPCQIAA